MANELKGVSELTNKLNRLDSNLQVKALRSVLFRATTPVVRQMRSHIPKGARLHRSYKGNLVAPSFASRSIKRLTGKKFLNKGKLSIAIGLKQEAWYALLYDQGPYTITSRRYQTSKKAKGHAGFQRKYTNIRPYTLKRVPWFESVFISNRSNMLNDIRRHLKSTVEKIARG